MQKKLTNKQIAILGLKALGYAEKEIAEMLCISYRTVTSYIHKARKAMNFKSSHHITHYMLAKGYIHNIYAS